MKKFNRRFFLKSFLSLGLFSLLPFKIKAFNFIAGDCETTGDIEGPFYIPNAPNISILTPPEITSNFLFITGTVYAKDCQTPIPNALVEVWHANRGDYDPKTNTYLNSDYEDVYYRAQLYTDNSGNYAYQTILPGKYQNGVFYRPSHIHYKSSYLNQNELTTQLYFSGDSSIDTDPWASDPLAENRIIPLETDNENNLHGVFDINLDVNPEDIITTSIKEENKLITSIYPNPINEQTIIQLKNTNENISIDICNINGKIVAKKENVQANIKLLNLIDQSLPKGIYILRVLQNKIPIDAKRFIITK